MKANAKFKDFLHELIVILKSLSVERDSRAAAVATKASTKMHEPGSLEEKYQNLLTPFATSLMAYHFSREVKNYERDEEPNSNILFQSDYITYHPAVLPDG